MHMLSNGLRNRDAHNICASEQEGNAQELHHADRIIIACKWCKSGEMICHIFWFWDAMLIYIIQPFPCQTVKVH